MPALDFRTGQHIERPAVPAPAPAKPAPQKRKRGSRPEETRKALLAKVHVAKKQLALTEPEYRALLDGHFGTDTAAALGVTDLKRLVLVMQEYGFTPKRGSDWRAARQGRARCDEGSYGHRQQSCARRGANRRKAVPAPLNDENDLLAPGVATQEATHGDSNGLLFETDNEYAVAIRTARDLAYGYRQRKPLMEKIEALLAEKGRVEGTHVPWGYAVAVLKRQSGGVTRCFEHATPEQLQGVIAALMYDARRHGRRRS